jgi:hypothetical protein
MTTMSGSDSSPRMSGGFGRGPGGPRGRLARCWAARGCQWREAAPGRGGCWPLPRRSPERVCEGAAAPMWALEIGPEGCVRRGPLFGLRTERSRHSLQRAFIAEGALAQCNACTLTMLMRSSVAGAGRCGAWGALGSPRRVPGAPRATERTAPGASTPPGQWEWLVGRRRDGRDMGACDMNT